MAIDAFVQACQEGNVEAIQQQFEQDASFDVNSKDVHGMTGLAYAARNGHVEVVRELLQKGAEKAEVVEQGYGLNNREIASLFGVPAPDEHGNGEGSMQPVYHQNGLHSYDLQNGHQLPDGSVAYAHVNGEPYGQAYPMPSHFDAAQYGHQFYTADGMHAPLPQHMNHNFARRANGNHSRKESATGHLPPPEVARMIPCKFFPTCRYGDKCVFAHPIVLPGPPPPMQGNPLSPTMSPPPPHHMQTPMFYQQMPPGYPYPPYAAGPQQFMSTSPAGHAMQPFGAPPTFEQGMMQPQEAQQQQEPSSLAEGETSADGVAANADEGVGSSEIAGVPAEPLAVATEEQKQDSKENDKASPEEQYASANESVPAKPVHRRQSFNSFLHHHAIPFQPQGFAMAASEDAAMLLNNGVGATRGAQGGGKFGARRHGANGTGVGTNVNGLSGKRSNNNGERPACTFFQAGRCRYGEECRFPHVLADGTDARPIQAQQRQMYAAQFEALNGEVRSNGLQNGNANAPASAPTGPQADKRSQPQQQNPSQSQSSPASQTARPSEEAAQQPEPVTKPTTTGSGKNTNPGSKSSSNNNNANGNANGIVRSQPSKTSTQGNTSGQRNAASGSGSGKKNSHSQRQQKQQPQQPQQRIPTTSDFPALSPNPNASSSATSPLPTPPVLNGAEPVVNGDALELSGKDAGLKTAPAPFAPKVNFSAILSAPAPVKAKVTEEATVQPVNGVNGNAHEESAESNEGKAEDGSDVSQSTPVKTHAAAAAAGITSNGATVNGTPKIAAPQQPKTNGTAGAVRDKSAPVRASAGPAGKDGKTTSSQQSSKSAAVALPAAAAKTNGVEAGADDDFQLVNRSKPSHKRPTQNGGGGGKRGEGYTHQAKAVVA